MYTTYRYAGRRLSRPTTDLADLVNLVDRAPGRWFLFVKWTPKDAKGHLVVLYLFWGKLLVLLVLSRSGSSFRFCLSSLDLWQVYAPRRQEKLLVARRMRREGYKKRRLLKDLRQMTYRIKLTEMIWCGNLKGLVWATWTDIPFCSKQKPKRKPFSWRRVEAPRPKKKAEGFERQEIDSQEERPGTKTWTLRSSGGIFVYDKITKSQEHQQVKEVGMEIATQNLAVVFTTFALLRLTQATCLGAPEAWLRLAGAEPRGARGAGHSGRERIARSDWSGEPAKDWEFSRDQAYPEKQTTSRKAKKASSSMCTKRGNLAAQEDTIVFIINRLTF